MAAGSGGKDSEEDPAGVRVRRLVDPFEREAALLLREAVFCGEQGVSLAVERDADDARAVHLGAFAGGRLVGTCRLLADEDRFAIGRVAVRADRRRRGVGAALIDAALSRARSQGVGSVVLHAQVASEAFYARQGFIREGQPFLEEDIEHVAMRCELRPRR